IFKHFNGNIKDKIFTIWGVSFKPNTDDIREAPSITLVDEIVNAKGIVHFYDPVANSHFLEYMREFYKDNPEAFKRIRKFENKYDSINDADALVVLTDWSEFKAPDFMEIKMRLKNAVLFDSRNLYSTARVLETGFTYYAMGKNIPVTDSYYASRMAENNSTVKELNKQIFEREHSIDGNSNHESRESLLQDKNWINSTQL
ncbi:MAG: hypothetical protein HQK51_12085, partial [Oligoflexia bacterium]|nr:hypothetical protein [Oligoflexia bacterium]